MTPVQRKSRWTSTVARKLVYDGTGLAERGSAGIRKCSERWTRRCLLGCCLFLLLIQALRVEPLPSTVAGLGCKHCQTPSRRVSFSHGKTIIEFRKVICRRRKRSHVSTNFQSTSF